MLQSLHTIAYVGHTPPQKLDDEVNMKKEPIRIVPNAKKYLSPQTRVDMSIEYPIRYRVEASDQGYVHSESMPKLLEYRNEIRSRANRGIVEGWESSGPGFYNPLTGLYT